MQKTRSIMALLSILISVVFSVMGCGDNGDSNTPDAPSHVALFGYSNASDKSWFSTTPLEDSGATLGSQLAGNMPQHDGWCKAAPFNMGGQQYVFSQECGDQWMITRILESGHLGAVTDSGSWESYEIVLSLKTGSRQFVFVHMESGHWKIMEILTGGKMGQPTDEGRWDDFYGTMAAFQMPDGRNYVLGQNRGDNGWFIREILAGGKMGKQTDEGRWDDFYGTMAAFQMPDGRNYVLGQNQGDNGWFIREILAGGKMGQQTDEGHLTDFHKTIAAYQSDHRQYIFGQNQDSNDWFIHQILDGGIMGKRTDEGQAEFFYRIVFPVSYDPVYNYTQTWMTLLYGTIENRPLKNISLPGSHDAGMSETNICFWGNDCNTQTQTSDFYHQLSNGVRYFDLRPVLYKRDLIAGGGKWLTAHVDHSDILGFVGCTGQTFDEAIGDIQRFLDDLKNKAPFYENHKELVIVNFSHCYKLIDQGETGVTGEHCDDGLWREVIGKAFTSLEPYMMSMNCDQIDCANLVSLPYKDLMSHGGHVIFRVPDSYPGGTPVAVRMSPTGDGNVLVDQYGDVYARNVPYDKSAGGDAVAIGMTATGNGCGYPNQGIFCHHDFPIYNEYSDTNVPDDMIFDQKKKYEHKANHVNQMFLLSWTLTLSEHDAIHCPSSEKKIIDRALDVNSDLMPVLDSLYRYYQIYFGLMPNILYTDAISATETSAAIWVNQHVAPGPHDHKQGIWLMNYDNGDIYTYGNAHYWGGGTGGTAADMDVSHTGKGYILLDEKGGVHHYGDVKEFDGAPRELLAAAIALNPITAAGAWILDYEGQIYGVGDCVNKRYGNAKGTTVDMDATPTGNGYIIVDQQGNVYPKGDAPKLGHPSGDYIFAQAICLTPSGKGYWILNYFNKIYAFGDAVHYGDPLAGIPVDMGVTPSGKGYWVFYADGTVGSFGDAEGFFPTDTFAGIARAIGVNPMARGSFAETGE